MSRRKLKSELSLPRRTMLKGALGGGVVAMALPLLEAMVDEHGEAHADGTELPRRLLTWMFGNGCRLEHWIPAATGPDYTLTPELEPLAAVKSDVRVLTGFRNYVCLLYTSPSPRDQRGSRMPSSA